MAHPLPLRSSKRRLIARRLIARPARETDRERVGGLDQWLRLQLLWHHQRARPGQRCKCVFSGWRTRSRRLSTCYRSSWGSWGTSMTPSTSSKPSQSCQLRQGCLLPQACAGCMRMVHPPPPSARSMPDQPRLAGHRHGAYIAVAVGGRQKFCGRCRRGVSGHIAAHRRTPPYYQPAGMRTWRHGEHRIQFVNGGDGCRRKAIAAPSWLVRAIASAGTGSFTYVPSTSTRLCVGILVAPCITFVGIIRIHNRHVHNTEHTINRIVSVPCPVSALSQGLQCNTKLTPFPPRDFDF